MSYCQKSIYWGLDFENEENGSITEIYGEKMEINV